MSIDSVQNTGQSAATEQSQDTDQFYSIVEHSPQSILFLNPEGTVTYANRKGQELIQELSSDLGVSPQKLVGGSISQLFTKLPELKAALSGLTGEQSITASLGDRSLKISLNQLASAGTILTWEDITEQVKLEESNCDYSGQLGALRRSSNLIWMARLLLPTIISVQHLAILWKRFRGSITGCLSNQNTRSVMNTKNSGKN